MFCMHVTTTVYSCWSSVLVHHHGRRTVIITYTNGMGQATVKPKCNSDLIYCIKNLARVHVIIFIKV